MIYLGLIGKPSDWLISCEVNKDDIKNKLGIELIDISLDEVYSSYSSKLSYTCEDETLLKPFKKTELDKAYRLYLALCDIVEKYHLSGFTIRCFDLLSKIKTTACLALAIFNKNHIVATCEGNIPALISMYLVESVEHLPSFQANPSRINIETNSMVLAHCTLPLSMCNSFRYLTHYESGIGLAIKGELRLANVYLFRISSSLNEYVLLKGHIERNLNEATLCRTQVEIKLDPECSTTYFLEKPLGNHHMIIETEDISKLINYLDKYKIKRVC